MLLLGISGALVVAVVLSYALHLPGLGGISLDTTGDSANQGSAPKVTPTPPVTQGGGQITGDHKPFILLSPSVVRQGSNITAMGSDFSPKAIIDFYVKHNGDGRSQAVGFIQADENGAFNGAVLNLPASQPSGAFTVEARQRHSSNVAASNGILDVGLSNVKLGAQVGKTGDVIGVSASGFQPNEAIKVYWNKTGTNPIAILQADATGSLTAQQLTVPFGAIGTNNFIFVGDKSQQPVSVPFLLLNLYPSVKLSSYAIQADNMISFSGKDFGPNESVQVYVNSPEGKPILKIQTSDQGAFTNVPGFVVPFNLKGAQTIIFIGQQSHTPATVNFDVLPYTPNAQPSTYGGRPGTAVTFYVGGFARNEVVHVYVGATRNNPGTMVGCFKTDGQGNAMSVGSYVIPADAHPGQLSFTLTGSKSGASAQATIQVMPALGTAQIPTPAPFTCSLDTK